VEFENCRQAAKRNIETPAGWRHGDLLDILTTDGNSLPKVPRCFFALLQELKTQSSVSKLAGNFFFAVPETEFKVAQQLEQILEVLLGVGVVRKTGELYRAVDQNLLESRRQSASNWLKNESKGLIKELEDLFPNQANILLSASYPTAIIQLEEAEKKVKAIDFSLLTAADIDSLSDDVFQHFVGDILSVETLIAGVCPLDIGDQSHQAFDCSPAGIIGFETRYNSLSLWEKVSFLTWLKKTFLNERDSLIQEIDELIAEAANLAKAEGEPFPIAPLTLPLKAIRSELENTVRGPKGGTGTRMATIKVAQYTLLIDQYLIDSKYDFAWKRMDALRSLISKDKPQSFFARFKKLHSQWERAVKQFKGAEDQWKKLADFLSDAPQDIVDKLSLLKAEMKKYETLISGGLQQQIQSLCDDLAEDQLLDSLKTEVEASAQAVQPLEQSVRNQMENIQTRLRDIIRKNELRALNRVLKVHGRPVKEEPAAAATYAKTKLAYESFNGDVAVQGRGFFDDIGKATNFELWVDICTGLQNSTYEEENHPDHAKAIMELKAMKLIRSKLELG
jgi:gas vesicle protein